MYARAWRPGVLVPEALFCAACGLPEFAILEEPPVNRASRLVLFLILALPAGGCTAGNLVGHFTALSTKVYASERPYVLLGHCRGESRSFFGGANLEDAVEDALRQAPGGVYMTNVVVKHGGFPSGYEVEGDVYGVSAEARPTAASF
jgi:hypothetical protein